MGYVPRSQFFIKEILDVDLTGDDWQKAKAQTEVRVSCCWVCEVARLFIISAWIICSKLVSR